MMDYEKAYKEALERARKSEENSNGMILKKWLWNIFPELKESDDEKVRKHLISLFEKFVTLGVANECETSEIKVDDILAWLEKQKEFVSADFDDVWEWADCEELTAPLEKYSKDAIKEMCHAWYDKGIELERKSWLKKQGEQKPTWNEEDEKMVKDIIAAIDTLYYHKMVNWLKSLKDRVQPQNMWKPSEEQINAIRLARSFVVDDFGEHPTLSEILMELEEQLQKIKENTL